MEKILTIRLRSGWRCLVGAMIVYSVWLILAAFSFGFVRVEDILVIFENIYEVVRWPVGIYLRWLKAVLTFLVPIAFAVTVPSGARVFWPPQLYVYLSACILNILA